MVAVLAERILDVLYFLGLSQFHPALRRYEGELSWFPLD